MRYLVLCIAFLAAGCSSTVTSVETVSPDSVDLRIADGLQRIAGAYEQLALINSATQNHELESQTYNYDESLLPQEWLKEITLLEDYHGDLGHFVEMASQMAGINSPRIDRGQRDRPVIVSVRRGTRKFISFMADVGFQAGDEAIVSPDINLNKVILQFSNG